MDTTYRYKAIDKSGKFHSGTSHAKHTLQLESTLQAMGLELISYKKVSKFFFKIKSLKISRQELITFTFQLHQLQHAGVSLLDSLKDIKASSQQPRVKQMLNQFIQSIQGGKTFSQSLESYPGVFNPVYIALIKVGEETGQLSEVMHNMAENLKWQDELIAHTQKIMIYPGIVSLVIFSVISYLLIFLVPNLIPFVKQIGGSIPLQTRALIASSEFFQQYVYLIFSSPIFIFIVLKILIFKSTRAEFFLDTLKIRTYLIGPIILKSHLARFSNYFAMMYTAGLNILDSLKIAESLMGNKVLTKSIKEIHGNIIQGESLSDSFSHHSVFPPLVTRMIKVGETTGKLDTALLNVSYFYNREVKQSIEKFQAMISPLLTLIMGAIMLWIMSAILSPIYDSLSSIG